MSSSSNQGIAAPEEARLGCGSSSDALSVAQSCRRALETALGFPFEEGNWVQPLKNGVQIFPAMLDAIAAARHSVHLLTYVYWTGSIAQEVADALAARARAGVTVRVLLDAFGARSMSQELLARMAQAGVDIHWFRPLASWRLRQWEHRTHRKVLVVDGHVGFTGGVGIAREWEGDARNPSEWRETHFRVAGPAVRGLQAAFLGNWFEACGETVAVVETRPRRHPQGESLVQVVRSSASVGWSDVAILYRYLVEQARSSLRITAAYFVPDRRMVDRLIAAAQRGVAIEILMPGRHMDYRVVQEASEAAYADLLEAGIRIWRYQPTMMHAKIITMDGQVACVGSANFNHRSMIKDDEVCLVVLDAKLVGILDEHFDEDRRRSEQYTLRRWRRRGFVQRLKETVGQLFQRHF